MPSPKRPTDEDFKAFEFTPGVGVSRWRGVVRQASGAFPQDDQIRDGINIRSSGDRGYRCRGGQEKGASTQVSGAMDGIFEASDTALVSPQSSLASSLLAFYVLDEVSSTRADSLDTYDLDDINTVTQSAGKIGSSAQFLKANLERLHSAGNLKLSGNFTIAAWIFVDTFVNIHATWGAGIASFHTNTAGQSLGDFFFSMRPTGALVLAHWKTSAVTDLTGYRVTTTTPVTTGSFQHVIARRRGSTYSIWHNGSSQALEAETSTSSGWGTTEFNIGSSFVGDVQYHWSGRIDEFGIWNRALSDTEIAVLYNGGTGLTYPFEP